MQILLLAPSTGLSATFVAKSTIFNDVYSERHALQPMGIEDHNRLTLVLNCAACHGLFAWAEREGLLQSHQLVAPPQASPACLSQQLQTLLATTQWALQCLGVSDTSSDFWRGWADEQQARQSRSWHLGRLCRTAPTVLKHSAENRSPMGQAAMYHCYEALLLNPDQKRSGDVDANVDDRVGDLKLSEAVYRHNFKQPLNTLINQIVSQHTGPEPFTIIDVGAGSGGMLLDVAESVLKTKKKAVFVAFDPSEVSRESCSRQAREKPSIKMHVADGSIEDPANILQYLRANNIPTEHCIVLAKAALHDRKLSNRIQTRQITADSYVYRDEEWKRVEKQQVIDDMIEVLNAWRQEIPSAKLIILESHLLPTHTITEQLERIPLLPAYLSHSLSAQYLLSADDHHQATQQASYKEQLFIPIQVMPDQSPLMSVTLLGG